MGTRDNHAGISYSDVAREMTTLGRSFNGRVRIQLDLPFRAGFGPVLTVRIALWQKGDDGKWRDLHGASSVWPNNENATMTGLLLRLCWELDKKLSEHTEALE